MKYAFCYRCGEKTERRLNDGRQRAFCSRCQEYLYENPVPSVAVICSNPTGEVLLVKRKVEPGTGGWCLPGGFIEIGETPEQAALRELSEETGLHGRNPHLIGVETHLNGFYGDVLIIGFAVELQDYLPHPSDDAGAALFFPCARRPQLIFRVHENFLRAWEKINAKPETKSNAT